MKKEFNEHKPVLLAEILDVVSEFKSKDCRYLDVTFGRGGHAAAIIDHLKVEKTVAFDQDQRAIDYGESTFANEVQGQKIKFIKANFDQVLDFEPEILHFFNQQKCNVVLADLGVSSPQLDDPERGFSFYNSGPLDMRMNTEQELTAADIVNNWTEEELFVLFKDKGEIRNPTKAVTTICEFRKQKSFTTTKELSDLIVKTFGWRKKGQHPATQVFLALRLEVNKELEVVEKSIENLLKLIEPGGLLLIITFHSLEDRIVKYKFKELAEQYGQIVTKKVIQPTWHEKNKNKRARSAKLRVFRRN